MTVHNHGPYEGEGLDCNETLLSDGSLKGKCLLGEETMGDLLKHHYDHQELVDGCLDCDVERAFEYAEIGERQVRDFLGRLDDLGIVLERKAEG